MNKITAGRTLISISVALGATGSTIVDNLPGSQGHMQAIQTWPPHALFHDAAMFLLLDGISLICLWLMLRRSREPLVAARVATLLVIVYWTPFFYVTTLFPQASLAPSSPVGMPYHAANHAQWDAATQKLMPIVLGIPLYGNAVAAAGWILVAIVGYWLMRRGIAQGSFDSRLVD